MINRDQLRLEKQRQCDERIEALYGQIPLLREIDQTIGQKNIAMIRVGILQKNKKEQQIFQQQIEQLLAKRHQLLQEYGLDESVYEPQWVAPKSGIAAISSRASFGSCYQQERLPGVVFRSGMPAAMRQYTFDNFYADKYLDPADMEKKIVWCKQFAWQIEQGQCEQCLFLTGDVGRGKTHLSAAIANEVMAHGNTVIYKRRPICSI